MSNDEPMHEERRALSRPQKVRDDLYQYSQDRSAVCLFVLINLRQHKSLISRI